MTGPRAASVPLQIEQGASFEAEFCWQDASGRPVDLTTGWDAIWQVRPAPGGELLLELTVAQGGIVLGGLAGTVKLWMPRPATAALPIWTQATHELLLMRPSTGHARRLVRGPITISAAVVQP